MRAAPFGALLALACWCAGAAAQAKLVFGEHPLRMWNRAIYVDVANTRGESAIKRGCFTSAEIAKAKGK